MTNKAYLIMEVSKMKLKLRQINRPSEEREKTIEMLERIKEHHSDNEPLIHAVNNSLFLHILAAIELLRPDLKFATELFRPKKDKKYMTDMVRYDIDHPKGRRKAAVWVKFPSSESKYNTVQCKLQKFGYMSPKVELPGPTDVFNYPRLIVHDFPDIDELIGCLNEALPNIHRK